MKSGFQTVRILGSEIHILTVSEAVDCLRQWIEAPDGECHRITVTGFHGIWEASQDGHLRAILNSADLWVADGIAPVLVARLKGMRRVRRIPGADLMDAFFRLANRQGYGSFFYGDTDATLAALQDSVQRRYPGHRICGTYSPPFRPLTSAEDERVVQMINETAPDVVWVGLGLPKQDRWIFKHKDQLYAPAAIGVGAAFRFHAGIVKRVPEAVGNLGLEWLWRLAMEPRKLWKRDLVDGPRFLLHVALELLRIRKYEQDADSELPVGPEYADRGRRR